MSGLKYMKTLGIIHCDLKPENILLKQKDKSGIVIADFGSGTLDEEIVYTYIQSRFYRAPEIILGLPYGCPIDMWSFGCILSELYMGKKKFFKFKDFLFFLVKMKMNKCLCLWKF